ncbi:MAG: hypothetical protein R3D33_12495 [Hyphomicrobiaceae bacterium]
MVQAEIEGVKAQKRWASTNGCTDATAQASVTFCQQFHELSAELAAAVEADKVQARIDEIRVQLASSTTAAAVTGSSDPQVAVLANLSGQNTVLVQTALTVLVALLVELGSSLGYFVVFSAWRAQGEKREEQVVEKTISAPVTVAKVRPAVAQAATPTANDNRTTPKLAAPENDVERFYKDRIDTAEGSSLTATALYENYCDWCEENTKEPMALPTFGRQFGELGVHKAKIAGRIRYIGIKLQSGIEEEEDRPTVAQVAA